MKRISVKKKLCRERRALVAVICDGPKFVVTQRKVIVTHGHLLSSSMVSPRVCVLLLEDIKSASEKLRVAQMLRFLLMSETKGLLPHSKMS
jgi:hypothetical protein